VGEPLMTESSRRVFLQTLLSGVAGASLARGAAAQSAPPAAGGFTTADLGGRVRQVSGPRGNLVLLEGPDSLLLVNGCPAEHAAALVEHLNREFPGRPIATLFNTDWHPEHTGLNERVGTAGGAIVAHENTKQWLGTTVHAKWEGRTYRPLPVAARPTRTFYTTDTLDFAGERVACGYLGQAHTDGDLYVHLPGPDVLVAGDVVAVGRYPDMDVATGGWIGGLTTATRTLVGLASTGTRVVPGEGPVQTRAHLEAQLAMLSAVRERVVKLFKSGLSAEEMRAAAPTKDFDAVWGSPDRFMKTMYQGLWGHARELGGII
jgi:glyoxylase-like metal-dependent hydrolase (beta-lactamase superfamily II)